MEEWEESLKNEEGHVYEFSLFSLVQKWGLPKWEAGDVLLSVGHTSNGWMAVIAL